MSEKTNNKRNSDVFRLSFDHPVYLSDMAIHTILDKAFIEHKAFEAIHVHSHPYYEIHICMSGEYKLSFLEHTDVIMQPFTICLIPPGVNHRTEKLSDEVKNLAVCFTYKQTSEKKGYKKIYDSIHAILSQQKEPKQYHSEQIYTIAAQLQRETLYHSFASDVLEQLLLSQLYTWLFRLLLPDNKNVAVNEVFKETPEVRYLRIDRYLQEHFCESITEEELAEYMAISKRQLSRVFKKIYGMSFHEKLTELRLIKATELLLHTDISVEDVAYRVGYQSYSGFSVVFKKKYGMTASKYKNLYKRS